MVERMTLNHVVAGSIPAVGVIYIYFGHSYHDTVIPCNYLSYTVSVSYIMGGCDTQNKFLLLAHQIAPSMNITHYSSVGRAGDCNVITVIPRSLVRIQLVRYIYH